VRVLDNLSSGSIENLAGVEDRLELLRDDIRDVSACRRAAEGVEVVFHQAALGSVPRSLEDPRTTLEVNVTGTTNIFVAAREAGVRRVVYASSSSVYGNSAALPKREGSEGDPLSPYALSKQMNEQVAGTFGRCFHQDLIGLRYFNVYGPRQSPDGPYAAVIPRFLQAAQSGIAPAIFGDGQQTRDFTYVRDAVGANLAAASATPEHRVFNVCTGLPTPVAELASHIQALASSDIAPSHEPARPGDVHASHGDPSRAEQEMHFAASTVLSVGLRETAEYFRSQVVA